MTNSFRNKISHLKSRLQASADRIWIADRVILTPVHDKKKKSIIWADLGLHIFYLTTAKFHTLSCINESEESI